MHLVSRTQVGAQFRGQGAVDEEADVLPDSSLFINHPESHSRELRVQTRQYFL
jgi:hypothetical protein